MFAGRKDDECIKKIQSKEECQETVTALGLEWDGDRNWPDRQTSGDEDVNWNTNPGGQGTHLHQRPICIRPEVPPRAQTILQSPHGHWQHSSLQLVQALYWIIQWIILPTVRLIFGRRLVISIFEALDTNDCSF